MSFPTIASAGTSDRVFVRRLREFVEDMPLFAPEQLNANGTSTEYRVTQFPMYDGDPNFSITVGGTKQTLKDNRTDLIGAGSGFIVVDWETGWVFWDVAPASGTNNVQFRKSKTRWRDERMLEALYNGLKEMFPKVWQRATDTSITLQVNQWDYTLPQVFRDPRVRVLDVEVQSIPNAYERFHPIQNYRRVGPNIIQFPQSQYYTPGSIVRVSYNAPYESLGDLEPQLEMLPLYYAKGYLLSNRETVRVRFDQSTTTQNESSNPPGISQNSGEYWFRKFYQTLDSLKRPLPMGSVLYTYQK